MSEKITYKDIVAMRECLENAEVQNIEDFNTLIPNGILFQACNYEEWQDKRIKELEASISQFCITRPSEDQMIIWQQNFKALEDKS